MGMDVLLVIATHTHTHKYIYVTKFKVKYRVRCLNGCKLKIDLEMIENQLCLNRYIYGCEVGACVVYSGNSQYVATLRWFF